MTLGCLMRSSKSATGGMMTTMMAGNCTDLAKIGQNNQHCSLEAKMATSSNFRVVQGDLLSSAEPFIVHQCNCRSAYGKGVGIALLPGLLTL